MKKNRILALILVLLVVALAAVAGVIVFKQAEYKASEDFYQSLRTTGALGKGGGLC